MKKYTHLSQDERVLLFHYHDNGIAICQIAQELNRSKSTVSRELGRNKNKSGYNPKTAEKRYLARRARPCLLDKDMALQHYVLDRLYVTPELISVRLRALGALRTLTHRILCKSPQKGYLLLIQSSGRCTRLLNVPSS